MITRVRAAAVFFLAVTIALPATAQDVTSSSPESTRGEIPVDFEKWVGDFNGMVKRRLVRVLVVYSKTQYFFDRGTQYGAAYELLRAFEDHLNQRLKTTHLKLHIAFVPTERENLIPALLEGRGDLVAAAITITPERQQQVDFGTPMFTGINEIVVSGPQSPAVATLEDLAGQEVFVRKSSSYWEHLERLNERFSQEGRPVITLRPAPENLEDEDLLEMVNAGLIGLIIVDDYTATLWANAFKQLVLHPEIVVNTGGQFAWMIRPGSPRLQAAIRRFAKAHRQGTAFGNMIVKKYALNPKLVTSATSAKEMKKFQTMVGLFRKYSDRYDMDYLLMMAQGYQESRLDQNARSEDGAVGVMQIMPATGDDLKVGDVTKLGPNIHAGVKYLRFMVDQYFEKEPMDKLNKMLFALAAYNAGPERIQQLRREAVRRRLNPHVWFYNVEVVAADKLGSETVTYVSNIYKYYVAYKLVTEQEEERRKTREAIKKEAGS